MTDRATSNSGIFVIGSPIVDIFAKVKMAQVLEEGLQKGLLCLLKPRKVKEIISKVEISQQLLGGSAANTAVGVGYLGGESVFAGSCGPDQVGDFFKQSLQAKNVKSCCTTLEGKDGTTRVYVLITEDGERTMLPIYGASRHFSLDGACREVIARSQLVFADAYQFDALATEAAVLEAFKLVKKSGGLSALTLSDPNCVTHYQEQLLRALPDVDILIGNEDEMKLLFDEHDTEKLRKILSEKCVSGEFKLIIATLNKEGSIAYTPDGVVTYNQPVEVEQVVDQTGAGDFFAAGFFYAYLQGYSVPTCGKVGSLVAAHAVQQVGAMVSEQTKEEVAELLAGSK